MNQKKPQLEGTVIKVSLESFVSICVLPCCTVPCRTSTARLDKAGKINTFRLSGAGWCRQDGGASAEAGSTRRPSSRLKVTRSHVNGGTCVCEN